MDINDKLGKDRAQELEAFFMLICGDKPEVRDIVKNTKMYSFFTGKVHHKGFTASNGIDVYPPRVTKTIRKQQANIILHDITLKQYLFEDVIDQKEYNSLKAMLDSPDTENAMMVEMLLEVKHRPLWQKKRNQLKNKLKKLFK